MSCDIFIVLLNPNILRIKQTIEGTSIQNNDKNSDKNNEKKNEK